MWSFRLAYLFSFLPNTPSTKTLKARDLRLANVLSARFHRQPLPTPDPDIFFHPQLVARSSAFAPSILPQQRSLRTQRPAVASAAVSPPSLGRMLGGLAMMSGGRNKITVEDVLTSPQWPEKWPFSPADFRRMDESDDAVFYDSPRLVYHIDDGAVGALTEYYVSSNPTHGPVMRSHTEQPSSIACFEFLLEPQTSCAESGLFRPRTSSPAQTSSTSAAAGSRTFPRTSPTPWACVWGSE